MVTGHPRPVRVLEVDGRRSSRYESTYLDTVDLDSWTAAATRRRRRWKVRSRVYADTGERWLEVKTRGLRGATVKERLPHDGPDVSGHADAWVRDRLGAARVARRRPVRPRRDAAHQLPAYDAPAPRRRRPRHDRPRPALGVGPRHRRGRRRAGRRDQVGHPASRSCWTGACGSSATGRSGSPSTAPGWRCSPPTSPATAGTASPAATSPATSPSAKEPSHEPPRTPSAGGRHRCRITRARRLLRRRDRAAHRRHQRRHHLGARRRRRHRRLGRDSGARDRGRGRRGRRRRDDRHLPGDRREGVARGDRHDRRRDLRARRHPAQGQLVAAQRHRRRRPHRPAVAGPARRVRRRPVDRRVERAHRALQQLGRPRSTRRSRSTCSPRPAWPASTRSRRRSASTAPTPGCGWSCRTSTRSGRRRTSPRDGLLYKAEAERRLVLPRRRPGRLHRCLRPGDRRRRPDPAHRLPRLPQQQQRRGLHRRAARAARRAGVRPLPRLRGGRRQLRRHRRPRQQLVPALGRRVRRPSRSWRGTTTSPSVGHRAVAASRARAGNVPSDPRACRPTCPDADRCRPTCPGVGLAADRTAVRAGRVDARTSSSSASPPWTSGPTSSRRRRPTSPRSCSPAATPRRSSTGGWRCSPSRRAISSTPTRVQQEADAIRTLF